MNYMCRKWPRIVFPSLPLVLQRDYQDTQRGESWEDSREQTLLSGSHQSPSLLLFCRLPGLQTLCNRHVILSFTTCSVVEWY